MGRRTLLLIASILVAAVGTALIFLYVRGADKRAEKGAETVRVVFAVKAIPRGESISAAGASFKLVSVPRDTLPAAGAYYADKPGFDQLMAQPTNSAVVDIPANSMIRKSDFGGAGEASSIGVAPDKVAISMQLTDPNRAAGLLKPGTIVAVIITTDPATAKELGIRQIPRADPDAKYTISTAIMNDAKVISTAAPVSPARATEPVKRSTARSSRSR